MLGLRFPRDRRLRRDGRGAFPAEGVSVAGSGGPASCDRGEAGGQGAELEVPGTPH